MQIRSISAFPSAVNGSATCRTLQRERSHSSAMRISAKVRLSSVPNLPELLRRDVIGCKTCFCVDQCSPGPSIRLSSHSARRAGQTGARPICSPQLLLPLLHLSLPRAIFLQGLIIESKCSERGAISGRAVKRPEVSSAMVLRKRVCM